MASSGPVTVDGSSTSRVGLVGEPDRPDAVRALLFGDGARDDRDLDLLAVAHRRVSFTTNPARPRDVLGQLGRSLEALAVGRDDDVADLQLARGGAVRPGPR